MKKEIGNNMHSKFGNICGNEYVTLGPQQQLKKFKSMPRRIAGMST